MHLCQVRHVDAVANRWQAAVNRQRTVETARVECTCDDRGSKDRPRNRPFVEHKHVHASNNDAHDKANKILSVLRGPDRKWSPQFLLGPSSDDVQVWYGFDLGRREERTGMLCRRMVKLLREDLGTAVVAAALRTSTSDERDDYCIR